MPNPKPRDCGAGNTRTGNQTLRGGRQAGGRKGVAIELEMWLEITTTASSGAPSRTWVAVKKCGAPGWETTHPHWQSIDPPSQQSVAGFPAGSPSMRMSAMPCPTCSDWIASTGVAFATGIAGTPPFSNRAAANNARIVRPDVDCKFWCTTIECAPRPGTASLSCPSERWGG